MEEVEKQEKKWYKKWWVWVIVLIILYVIGGENSDTSSSTSSVDLCRCLTEPGNTDWAKTNKDACNKKISAQIGVSDWQSVNFSQNPVLSAKWDQMVEDCVH